MGTASTPTLNTNIQQNKQKPRCTYGPKCKYLKQGYCKYLHTPQELNSAHKKNYHPVPPPRSGSVPPSLSRKVARCTYGPKCKYLKQGYCKYLHTPQELKSLRKQDHPMPPPRSGSPAPPPSPNQTLLVLPPKAPSKTCKICEVPYNYDVHFPMMLVDCGHTFCLFCCKQLRDCPICRAQITKYLKNYQIFGEERQQL